MLSRQAEAFFSIGRHLARAESTARLLDGARDESPSAILACIARARESARIIRDRISREMWEDLSAFHLEAQAACSDAALAAGPSRFRRLIEIGSQRFHGVTEATMPRDAGWYFLRAGRALERAETVAGALLAGAQRTPDAAAWMTVLESVGADEAYRRRHRNQLDSGRVAELLLLDARHPRSLRFNVATLDTSLRAISRATAAGDANQAETLTGRLNIALQYHGIGDILARGLATFLNEVLSTCRAIGDEIGRSYFRGDRVSPVAAAQAAQGQQQ